MVIPGCLDGLHFEPSSNHLEECSWRWTIMQPPTLLCPRCTSHDTRLSAECLVFFPIVFYFPFYFLFLFREGWCHSRNINDGNIRCALASSWHVVVLALDCYTKPEMDRVKRPIQAHVLGAPISSDFTSNRFAQVGDVGQGVQRWSWILSNTTTPSASPWKTTKQTWLKFPASCYPYKVVSSHTKNIGT